MDNPYDHMVNQQMMAVSIFSFLDNLLDHVRQAEQEAENEMETVSDSVDPVAQARKDAGGYPDECLVHLSEAEKDEISCTICYCILRDPHQCKNQHLFCYSCIYAWSNTSATSSDYCPVCRCDALYGRNEVLNQRIQQLRSICKESECNWRGPLRDLESHEHRQYTDQELGIATVLPVIKTKSVPSTSINKLAATSGNTGLTSLLPTRQSTADLVRMTSRNQVNNDSSGNTDQTHASHVINTNTATGSPRLTGGTLLSRRDSQAPRRISNVENPRNVSRQESENILSQVNNPVRRNSVSSRNSSASTNSNNRQPASSSTSVTIHTPRPPNAPRNSGGMFRSRVSSVSGSTSESPVENSNVSTTTVASGNVQTIPAQTTLHSITSPSLQIPTSISSSETPSVITTQMTSSVINSETSMTATSTSSADTSDLIEYRRLMPIERRSRVANRLRESREQLAMMLTLMTLELEDRRRNVEMQMSLNTHRQRIRARQIAEMAELNQRLDILSTTEGSGVASSSNSLSANSLPPIRIINRNRNDMDNIANSPVISFLHGDDVIMIRNTRNVQSSDSSSTSSGDD